MEQERYDKYYVQAVQYEIAGKIAVAIGAIDPYVEDGVLDPRYRWGKNQIDYYYVGMDFLKQIHVKIR